MVEYIEDGLVVVQHNIEFVPYEDYTEDSYTILGDSEEAKYYYLGDLVERLHNDGVIKCSDQFLIELDYAHNEDDLFTELFSKNPHIKFVRDFVTEDDTIYDYNEFKEFCTDIDSNIYNFQLKDAYNEVEYHHILELLDSTNPLVKLLIMKVSCDNNLHLRLKDLEKDFKVDREYLKSRGIVLWVGGNLLTQHLKMVQR